MKPRELLAQIDESQIIAAIARAESRTSGEIRVSVSHRSAPGDPITHARKEFLRLKMDRTRHRNAVLIYLAPLNRSLAIVGDTAIHQRCGEAHWKTLANQLTASVHHGDFTPALTDTITRIGDLLAQHFPRPTDNPDALPNTLAHS